VADSAHEDNGQGIGENQPDNLQLSLNVDDAA